MENVKFEPLNKIRKGALSTSDTILSLFVIAPLTITSWRGAWGVMDIYGEHFPGVNIFFMGSGVHVAFAIARDILMETINNTDKSWTQKAGTFFIRRLYTYIFAIACIMHWRGGWAILDMFIGDKLIIEGYVGIACFIILIPLKGIRNNMAAPLVILLDNKDVIFNFPTRFRAKSSDKTSLYILDCLFSVFVIGSLVVFVWRGSWVLLDIYLYPQDFIWSSWISLILGYAIVAMAFSMQPAMRWLCDRCVGVTRVIVADIFLLFSVVGTINVWRGIWNLLDIYFLPDHPEISCWITHCVSLVLLILLNCSNSLLVRGVYIDAEESSGKCVVFPIYYLRLIFMNERIQKHNNLQLEAMAKRKHEIDCQKLKNENCTCIPEQNHVLLLQQTTESNHIEV